MTHDPFADFDQWPTLDEAMGQHLVFDKSVGKCVHLEQLSYSRHPLFKWCKWPVETLLGPICAIKKDPVLAVLITLERNWYVHGKKNPVKLGAVIVGPFQLTRPQKARAVGVLEELKLITVERFSHRSPSITMLWHPLKS
jgi:hypothetical protein